MPVARTSIVPIWMLFSSRLKRITPRPTVCCTVASRSPSLPAPPETVSRTWPPVRSFRFREKGAAAFRSTVPSVSDRAATTGSSGAGRPSLTL